MIFGKSEHEIVKLAVEYQSEMTDGVVQYDYESNELFGAGFTTGTVENPANKVIEVFRITQGENPIVFINDEECAGCDRYCKGISHDELRESDECIECCIDAYIENFGFDEDFEDFKDGVEEQVRELIRGHIWNALDKVDEVRIAILDKITPYDYVNNRANNTFVDNCIDSYVDCAMENGFSLETDPFDWIDGEIEYLALLCEDQDAFWTKVSHKIREHDFDGALKLIEGDCDEY